MNRERRKRVYQAIDLVGKAKEILDDVKSEEQDAYDNLPDSFRNGNRGEEMQGCMEMITEGWNLLDDAASVMEQIAIGVKGYDKNVTNRQRLFYTGYDRHVKVPGSMPNETSCFCKQGIVTELLLIVRG